MATLSKYDKMKRGQGDCGIVKERKLAVYSEPCSECASEKK